MMELILELLADLMLGVQLFHVPSLSAYELAQIANRLGYPWASCEELMFARNCIWSWQTPQFSTELVQDSTGGFVYVHTIVQVYVNEYGFFVTRAIEFVSNIPRL